MTGFPSATALALTLGADSPCADERCAGNLGLSASGPFTRFIATHVSIRTSDTSSRPLDPPSQAYGTLLYHRQQSLDCAVPTKPKVDALRSATQTSRRQTAHRGERAFHRFNAVRRSQLSTAVTSKVGGTLAFRRRLHRTQSSGLLTIRSFGYRLEPRYIFRAGRLDQ